MEPVTLAVVSLAVLMLLLSFGVPIVFCFSGALAFMSIVGGVTMKGMMMWGLQQILSPTLLCIPLFIYAGSLMSESGIAKYLLEFVDVFVGRIRGGLGFVATLTCAILGAISGSTFTGLAATGNMLIPEMVSRGYPRAFATALITCSSILGVLIPPSTPMIIFGWVTGTNVLACFLSTVGPGIVTIIIFCGINFVLSRRFDLKLMPQLSKTEKRRQIAVRGWKALPALIMPVLILGGIYSGAMTPTEAAAVAVIYALPVGFFVYRGLNLRNAFGCTKDSAVSVGSIMIMIFCSMMLSQTYVVLQIPQAIVTGGIVIAAIYLFSAFGIGAAVPVRDISPDSGLIDAVSLMTGGAGGTLVRGGALLFLVTLFGNMISWSMGVNSTAAYAADRGDMPAVFARRWKRNDMPVGSAVTSGIVASAVCLLGAVMERLSPDSSLFWSFFALNLVMLLLSYLPVFPAFLTLRRKFPDRERPFRVPGRSGFLKWLAYVPMALIILSIIFTAVPLSWDRETLSGVLPITVGSVLSVLLGEVLIAARRPQH